MEGVERERLRVLTQIEQKARDQGYQTIGGVDEAGRGPLAGPVVAAACVIPDGLYFPGINDSKKLTPKKREELFEKLVGHSDICYGIGEISSEIIDEINILEATKLAMKQAIEKLSIKVDLVLIDGANISIFSPSWCVVKGDSKSQSIAAASVIAKVHRDRKMFAYHEKWPNYGFDRHKGYGTEQHIQAIIEFGPLPIHRKSFDPIRSMLADYK